MSRDRIICDGENGCGAVVAVGKWAKHEEWHAYVLSLELRIKAMQKALGGNFVSSPASTGVTFQVVTR